MNVTEFKYQYDDEKGKALVLCRCASVIGIEPSDVNAMALSLHHGERIMLEYLGAIAYGVAVKCVGAKYVFVVLERFL